MPSWGSFLLIAFSYLVIPLLPAQAVQEDHRNTTFVFDGFNGSQLILEEGASVIRSKSVLAVTNNSRSVLGRALYSHPLKMKSNETLSSFSTTFVFSIVPPPSNVGAHGMAFVMMPHRSPMGALTAQYLGLLNLTSNGQPYNHLFTVEFDTGNTVEFNDPNSNHVGVNINSLTSVHTETAGYWNGEDFHGLNLKSGRNIHAWIDYDHLQSRLNVTLTLAGLPRPQRPLISLKIDLHNVLKDKMFVGFSAATGGVYTEAHYVLAWSFTTEGTTPPLDVSRLPSVANMYSKHPDPRFIASVTMACLVFFSLAIGVVVFLRRAKNRETIEGWEKEYWPHRFTYNELSIATSRFRCENVLGQGGFGKVYKGFLPSSNQVVAVKCITKEFTEGMKGFVAEISSMGRLQHRKATPSSDVFSFGVLLLEVACGRRPVDLLTDPEQMILAEWTWDLYTEGRLLEASDPKLGEDGYDVGEMEKVLKLGLLCCHPEPDGRPGMRHVCQILEGEAPLPDLCTASYNVSIMGDYSGVLFSYTGD